MPHIVITGCGSGFGRLAALDLARRGERVFATLRAPDRSDLAGIAEREGLPLTVHRLDVTDPASVARAMEEIGDRVDVLVNNAGYAQRGPLETLSDAEIAAQFDTNVTGVLRMVRAVVPGMRRRGGGRIVNVSSSSGLFAAPYEGLYSASKHAVEALSQVLSFELAGAGIAVRLVEPGAFETGFVANAPVAEAFTPGHPLWEEYHLFWERAAGLTGGERNEPTPVVEAIRRAALDDDAPFRQLVGDDAKFIVESQMAAGLEDTAPLIRAALGL
ncbi:SDR family oxidoreductase [Actinomadura kijaniata]|uniref:SDR family oxidoreductase n=1 Tax=Actinomadura kijaniata TaxID=46161 RepID=UPI003F1A6043